MNAIASSSCAKNSQARGKSTGWAAFGLKQLGDDPFPPLPTTGITSLRPCENILNNNGFSAGSFLFVLLHSADFPPITKNGNCNKLTQVSDSGLVRVLEEKDLNFVFNRLKELHSWADESLIEDIMASVNNDIDKATTLLEEMISTGNSTEKGEAKDLSNCDDFRCAEGGKEIALLGQTSNLAEDIADLSSTLEGTSKGNHKQLMDVHTTCGHRLSEAAAGYKKPIQGHLRSLHVELEGKSKISAARHSRAATNAFLRGDHFSAQQHSSKAHKEWSDAARLNAKAAKEILSIRNNENNPWMLDLHGLHAAEAVKALQEHLNKIETLLKNQAVSHGPFISIDVENLDKQQTGFRQRIASLQVITGVGNHSRGQAVLPTAVRSFLSENRYDFDEARLGVISVRPKFRHR
ncbi:hypothetical protein P3X46_002341 [Hevea brasiliensis]|uniref:Smr domain-containing protein n=1 Tax=Hevea brasiliensis TaxID=3981 RepID=A0ABQ9N3Q7_HEVBR|nr:hypothetical protein P3X46_002341 [Hevea brasiliensis]